MESNNPWKKYYKDTEGRPPRKELIEALEFVQNRDSALDLGAGAMQDSVYLLSQGFKEVIAVDSSPSSKELAPVNERLQVVTSTFEEFTFPTAKFDLVSAQFSLPFTHPQYFTRVFNSIKNSLADGGIFVGNVFGDRDEWNENPDMTFLDSEALADLLTDLEVIKLDEEERDGKTASGQDKHWHICNLILRKK